MSSRERYDAKPIETDAQFWVTVQVHRPQPGRGCAVQEPEDLAVGKSRLNRGRVPRRPPWNVPRLLSYFAPIGGDPLRQYVDFVTADVQRG